MYEQLMCSFGHQLSVRQSHLAWDRGQDLRNGQIRMRHGLGREPLTAMSASISHIAGFPR